MTWRPRRPDCSQHRSAVPHVSDDLAQLDAGMLLYDAFYRWARDATDEGHDWPAALNRN